MNVEAFAQRLYRHGHTAADFSDLRAGGYIVEGIRAPKVLAGIELTDKASEAPVQFCLLHRVVAAWEGGKYAVGDLVKCHEQMIDPIDTKARLGWVEERDVRARIVDNVEALL